MATISVIIPTGNAEKTIKKCVESVLANDYDDFEVIVIDDLSTDGTREILQGIKDRRLKILLNKTRLGAYSSRNSGIRRAEGEYVILLDADSFVTKDWIQRHVALHREMSAEVIGGGVIGIHKSIFGKCDNFCNWWTAIPNTRDYFLTKLHIPTNNMSIKKSIFEKVGYFHEYLMTGGDAEFCFRVLANRFTIYYKADLIAYHYDRDDFRSFMQHQHVWGRHAIKSRRTLKMDYFYLLPNSFFAAHFYILPLAILYTAFIVAKWIRYNPSVLLCIPIIFIGKLYQAMGIRNSFRIRPKH